MKEDKISFFKRLELMWKYEIKYYPKQFILGIKNICKWFPVIWKDRDWDDSFLFEIIKFKISKMAQSHG